MLRTQQIATIRAALHFWKEEIAPHEASVAQAYFDSNGIEPLGVAEIEIVRQQLLQVRYAVYNPASDRLRSTKLITANDVMRLSPIANKVATVILPR